MWFYVSLVVVRVLWSAFPQNGYIHPDEFFQSTEVTAGDALNITVERTWEFENEQPLRSMVINNALFTPTFYMLGYLSSTLDMFTLTGRIVLSSSRLLMAGLSFLLDYNVWRLCTLWKLDAYLGIVVLSCSYVILTYQTHSFSNSIESVLFVMIVGVIVQCVQRGTVANQRLKKDRQKQDIDFGSEMPSTENCGKESQNQNVRKREKRLQTSYLQSDHSTQPAKLKESLPCETSHKKLSSKHVYMHKGIQVTWSDCIILALLNTLGIFNRPTFALFSVSPFIWWCYCMNQDKTYLFKRVCIFVLVSLFTASIICTIDTFYYRGFTLSEFINGQNLFPKVVMTPWSFVKYNTDVSNLELHGKHPVYLHFLVNILLLFGPLALIIYSGIVSTVFEIFTYLRKVCFEKKTNISGKRRLVSGDSTTHTHHYVLLSFIVVPVVLLSLFPHQEPRFLIPLLPLVVVYSLHSPTLFKKPFVFSFILFNVILSLLYGVLHQGGLIPCLFKLQELSTLNEFSSRNTTVLFSHTYMPPKHLLLLNNTSNMDIIDLKGGNIDMIQDTLLDIKKEWSSDYNKSNNLLLAIPGTVLPHLKARLQSVLNLEIIHQFYFHLTLEDPPKIPVNSAAIRTLFDELSLYLLKVS